MLITAGFVLAAGALSLAELGVDAPGFSSSPDPAAAGGESSEIDGSTAEPSASGRPLDDRTDAGADEASPSPSASSSSSASASPSASPSDSTPTPREAQSATLPGSAAPTAPSASDPAPTADPTPSEEPPKPEPSPTETCTRFLWWCS